MNQAADRIRSESLDPVRQADRDRWEACETAALAALDDLRSELHRLRTRWGKREAARLTGLSIGTVQRWSVEVPSAAALHAARRARGDGS